MTIQWLKDGSEVFCRSVKRSIDRETLKDLLAYLEYQAERDRVLDSVGVLDNGDPTDILFTYILDAIGVPPDGYKSDGHEFSRIEFAELFYSDYLIHRKYLNIPAVLDELIVEAKDAAHQWGFDSNNETEWVGSLWD